MQTLMSSFVTPTNATNAIDGERGMDLGNDENEHDGSGWIVYNNASGRTLDEWLARWPPATTNHQSVAWLSVNNCHQRHHSSAPADVHGMKQRWQRIIVC
jgi:hypothetical protein